MSQNESKRVKMMLLDNYAIDDDQVYLELERGVEQK